MKEKNLIRSKLGMICKKWFIIAGTDLNFEQIIVMELNKEMRNPGEQMKGSNCEAAV